MLAKQMGSIAHIFSNPATNIAINPAFMKVKIWTFEFDSLSYFKLYNEHCILKARPLSDVPTAEQIREDMAFTAEPQLDPDEMGSVSAFVVILNVNLSFISFIFTPFLASLSHLQSCSVRSSVHGSNAARQWFLKRLNVSK